MITSAAIARSDPGCFPTPRAGKPAAAAAGAASACAGFHDKYILHSSAGAQGATDYTYILSEGGGARSYGVWAPALEPISPLGGCSALPVGSATIATVALPCATHPTKRHDRPPALRSAVARRQVCFGCHHRRGSRFSGRVDGAAADLSHSSAERRQPLGVAAPLHRDSAIGPPRRHVGRIRRPPSPAHSLLCHGGLVGQWRRRCGYASPPCRGFRRHVATSRGAAAGRALPISICFACCEPGCEPGCEHGSG